MQRSLVNPKNPLVAYKEAKGLTWKNIHEICGMSMPGIYYFIRLKPKDIMLCRIETAYLFKKCFDIDLVEYLNKNYK
jgi:hypothetical protein